MTTKIIASELTRLAEAQGGMLKPEVVVEKARPKSSPLHDQFEWDDSVAGHQYRLVQARTLIRLTMVFDPEVKREVPLFINLSSDREHKDGYRFLTQVLKTPDLRERALDDVLADLERLQKKYLHLVGLADVFKSMYKAIKKLKKAK